jgi:GntR family transcriptional regulator of vanillate catabolism
MSQTLRALLGVRDLIFSGAFAPDERLSEIAVSERLGLSRTPVRAALLRLEQEGLLHPIPTGGFRVRAFEFEDVADAIEIRGAMEGMAARRAAERGIAREALAELRHVLGRLDQAVAPQADEIDFPLYVEQNAAFHDALGRACGGALMRRELERAVNLPFAGPNAFIEPEADNAVVRASLAVAQYQHRSIVEAIVNREGARAEALAREHARLALGNLQHVLQNRNEYRGMRGLALVRG